ncbi:MAG: aldose 1-epimerase [Chitinophagaceae bacterium]|nr:aldose 1-epimerase [Chitinophagaceae bacterium]MCW5927439.1 aldose 1-epimerase [Chitinophagaceae bacterium]
MFLIAEKQEKGFDKIVLEDKGNCAVEVAPACGAMLCALKAYHENGFINVIDSYPDRAAFLDRAEENGFKGLKLSPFPCRVKNAVYQFDGSFYRLNTSLNGGDALHGLLYRQAFRVVDTSVDENSAAVVMEHAYSAFDSGYPFTYTCRVTYTLKKNNFLTIATTIINTGDKRLPVADGWHPYFTFGGRVDDLYLQFRSDQMLEFKDKVPTGKVINNPMFKEGAKVGAIELDNSFLLDFTESQPMCTVRDEATGWQLECYPDNTYPYLQIYIPPHRNSIAIENLSAPPDAFNNKISLTVLAPGEQAVYTTGFALRKI